MERSGPDEEQFLRQKPQNLVNECRAGGKGMLRRILRFLGAEDKDVERGGFEEEHKSSIRWGHSETESQVTAKFPGGVVEELIGDRDFRSKLGASYGFLVTMLKHGNDCDHAESVREQGEWGKKKEPMIELQHQEAGRRGAREIHWEGLARKAGGKANESRAPGKQHLPRNEAAVSHRTGKENKTQEACKQLRGRDPWEPGWGKAWEERSLKPWPHSLQQRGGMVTFLPQVTVLGQWKAKGFDRKAGG